VVLQDDVELRNLAVVDPLGTFSFNFYLEIVIHGCLIEIFLNIKALKEMQ